MDLAVNMQSAIAGYTVGIMALGVYITFRILDIPDLSCEGTFALGGCISAVRAERGTGVTPKWGCGTN